MQLMLILNETTEDFARHIDPERAGACWGGWNAFIGAMMQAGIVVNGDVLQGPALATTARVRDGKRHVADGPYADSKEQLARHLVIEVPDLDTALEWAAPGALGPDGLCRGSARAGHVARSMTGPETAERVARASYGKLLAILTLQSCAIAAFEDALSEAMVSALSA